jgi:hypothetical protein
MAQEYPDVPAERTRNRKKAPNKAKLESTKISASQEVESGLNGQVGENKAISEGSGQQSAGRKGQVAFPGCQDVGRTLPRSGMRWAPGPAVRSSARMRSDRAGSGVDPVPALCAIGYHADYPLTG